MRVVDYFQTISVEGLVDSCKIECKKGAKDTNKQWIDCEAIDVDATMKLESSWNSKIKGFKPGQTIAIYDLGKLINMLSYSEDGDSKEESGEIWIDDNELHYDGKSKRVDYKLADPELIDVADMEKTIGDFLDEELIEFTLNATHIRELIKGLGIVSSEYIKIFTEKGHIKAEIGEIDKLTIKVEKFKKLTDEDIGELTVNLDSRNISQILRTASLLKGNVRFAIKDNYPAVIKLENIGKDINTTYLISPYRVEEDK